MYRETNDVVIWNIDENREIGRLLLENANSKLSSENAGLRPIAILRDGKLAVTCTDADRAAREFTYWPQASW
jgi:hypothetical protein